MDNGFFLNIAMIAVTFMGFTGLVGAIRHRRSGNWKPNEIAGLKYIIEHAMAAMLVGLLPFPVVQKLNEARMWQLFSGALAVFLTLQFLIQIWRIKEATSKGTPPTHLKLMLLLYFLPSIIIIALLIMNIFVWNMPNIIMFTCVFLLYSCAMQFYVFVLTMREDTSNWTDSKMRDM